MAQAFLTKIHSKQTKVGVMYDLEFSNGDRVGVGKFQPKGIQEGEYYKYDIVQNGNFKNLAPGSLSKMDKPAGVSAAPAAPTKQYASSGSFDNRQTVISKQAALNSALAFVQLLQSAEALPIAKKDLTAAKAADSILGVVDHYTDVFYKQSTGEDFPREEAATGGLATAEAADTDWNE